MAKLQGISGMDIGDGAAGGKVALDLQTRILRILYDSNFSYMTATVLNPGQISAGTVSYQVPEVLQTEDYTDGTTGFQKLNSDIVQVNIDTRRTVKYTYETFDQSRLGSMEGIIGAIANSVAMAIQNDLNLHFWEFVAKLFGKKGAAGELVAQQLTLPKLVDKAATVAEIKAAVKELQWKGTDISKMYDKNAMGVSKAELLIFLDPYADINIRQIYDNQPNSLAQRWVGKDLQLTQLGGGVEYTLDKFIGMNFTTNMSFNKDKTVDLQNFVGFIIHNEAIAMPFNLNQMVQVIDPVNGNPKVIAKYQFGIGKLRKKLIWAITKDKIA